MYARSDTRLVLVALPEEMVVNETLETLHKLERDVRGLTIPLILLNRASPPTFTEGERSLLSALEAEAPPGTAMAEVLGAGRWEEGLEAATGDALARLEVTHRPVVSLPSLSRADGARKVTTQLAAAMARASGVRVDFRGHMKLSAMVAQQQLIVCVGSGGVGKTTTAASLASPGPTRGAGRWCSRSTRPVASLTPSDSPRSATPSTGSRSHRRCLVSSGR